MEEKKKSSKRSKAGRDSSSRDNKSFTALPQCLEDRFQIKALIDKGGFGAIFRAVDTKDENKHVIVKLVR